YGELAGRLDLDGVDALEVNISCPNVEKGGMLFGSDPDSAYEVVSIVRRATSKPVIAKLTPHASDVAKVAEAVREAGADAVSLINTLVGMAVDVETRRPKLGNVTGGLSGPAVRPVALALVWKVASAVRIPVIGIGGISSPEDALEFLIVGARAVQVGTATFFRPRTALEVVDGIREYMERHGFGSIDELSGSLEVRR
ncbi:MAG: dihydroorotate dehydrogenase, partial [Candidatus Latescibacterota bacterium]